ncbi:MAG: DUF362 domain-containing protein [bacterium]
MCVGAAGAAGFSLFAPACASDKKTDRTGVKAGAAKKVSSEKPIVVIARSEKIWKGSALDDRRTRELLSEAVQIVAGKKDEEAAWRHFFHSYETVGLKLNCLGGRSLSPRPELVRAICDGLESVGIKKSNIILWDQTDRDLRKAGYHITTAENEIRCVGSDHTGLGYDQNLSEAGSVGTLVCRIASTLCDALVNVPVLKDHDLAGVSISLKNYYGAILNPNKFHANGCDPYIADLNTMPVFREKTRLIICDATTAQYHGGPGYKSNWAWRYSAILVSTDPVALDAVGYSIIEEKRREAGLKSLAEEKRPPRHIASAAHPSRALGVADLNRIEIVKIS